MSEIRVRLESVDETLWAQHIAIREHISRPFEITLWLGARTAQLDLDGLIGKSVTLDFPLRGHASDERRHYHGVCVGAELGRTDPQGMTTYVLTVAPRLGLLDERHNYRHFQHQSVPDIARSLLQEWDVEHELRLGASDYPRHEMKVQYGESDLTFLERVLEREGISYYFESTSEGTKVVLDDRPQSREARTPALPHHDNPSQAQECVSGLAYVRSLRAGRYRVRGHDFRGPQGHELAKDAEESGENDPRLERYHYRPGAFHTSGHQGEGTPSADDRGAVRADEEHGERQARVGLERHQADRDVVQFRTSAFDLRAGTVFTLGDHPRSELANRDYLVRRIQLDLHPERDWGAHGVAVPTDRAFRPARRHGTRRIDGLVSATVVGPAGKEIHTDEFGRVRVKFHWDREAAADESSSAWLRVCDGWAGAGFGTVMLPRIGQEVVVGFLSGNPDDPVVIGRLYNATNPHPHRLPEHEAVSTWKSKSTPDSDGYNELRFDDRAGREQVFMHAEKNFRRVVKNDESARIGRDRAVDVKRDHREAVHRDEAVFVDGKAERTIGKESRRAVTEAEHHTSKAEHRHTVGGDRHLVTKGQQLQLVEGDLGQHSSRLWLSSDEVMCVLTQNLGVDADSAVMISGGEDIMLVSGGSYIRISPTEIVISAPTVRINDPGDTGMAGEIDLPQWPHGEPKEAEAPAPAEEGSADGHGGSGSE